MSVLQEKKKPNKLLKIIRFLIELMKLLIESIVALSFEVVGDGFMMFMHMNESCLEGVPHHTDYTYGIYTLLLPISLLVIIIGVFRRMYPFFKRHEMLFAVCFEKAFLYLIFTLAITVGYNMYDDFQYIGQPVLAVIALVLSYMISIAVITVTGNMYVMTGIDVWGTEDIWGINEEDSEKGSV